MEDVLKDLFAQWENRINNKKNDDKSSPISSEQTMDKNSKMLLNKILITNRKYMKEEIPLNYEYNEDTKQFENIDIVHKITPFVTDKTNLFKNLEKDRNTFLEKRNSSS